ncbi:MAG: TIGR00730 family Rossman fold protein [Phycisphaerales bacterium]|nr:TIGR00730 family Rossman fold protein [Phycisphaerales bacterium]
MASDPIDVPGVNNPKIEASIGELIDRVGSGCTSIEKDLVTQMMKTSLRMLQETHHSGQLKLMSSALKEMRYAYHIFNDYQDTRKVSIFGSARTPSDHPDYVAASVFSQGMAKAGWMVITGGGDGIMKAGHDGLTSQSIFGLAIRLPFETSANEIIEGDSKLINFRYFFTRKLMFLTNADAIVAFPGGFGTMDELFETLTLVQTGKSHMLPIVLVEGEDGVYWKNWLEMIKVNFVQNGWISPEDLDLFYLAPSLDDAVSHITTFYSIYHSSRFVRGDFVLRLNQSLSEQAVASLNSEFSDIVEEGEITQTDALPGETLCLDLPRLVFRFTRRNIGRLRMMIDRINELGNK